MIADIVESIVVDASPARVWHVLTGEGLVEQWLGCLEFRAETGHVFYMQPDPAKRAAGDLSGATHCELLALDAPHAMVFSWYYPDTPRTTVTIRLTPSADSTLVQLVHTGWDQFDPGQIASIRDMLAGGWKSSVLPGLKQLAESQ